jgi:hypothetical protein
MLEKTKKLNNVWDEDFFYLLFTGDTADTLKEARQKLGVSGRALPHCFNDGRIKKIYRKNPVKNEKENENVKR